MINSPASGRSRQDTKWSTAMRRFTIVTLLGSMVMMVGAVGMVGSMSGQARAVTQTDTPAIVGSWQLMGVGAPGTPPEGPILATFSADGPAIISARAVRPALPGMPHLRSCTSVPVTAHGRQTRTGRRRSLSSIWDPMSRAYSGEPRPSPAP